MEEVVLDIDALKRPITSDLPAGADPRSDVSPSSHYYTLKDVRNSARAAERNALVDNENLLSFANLWQPIIDKVPDLLGSECKDLELVAWLIEALARRAGFQGLATGFRAAATLIEHHWDDLFPLPDEDGLETRIAPLVGLNGYDGEGTLLMPIACIPITEQLGEPAFATWEYEQALEVERLDSDKKRQKIDAGAVDLKDVKEAASASSPQFYRTLHASIQTAIAAFDALADAMDKATAEPQPTSQISKRLKACLEAVEYLAGDKLAMPAAMPEAEQEAEMEAAGPADANAPFEIQLASRQQAIESLRQIADFFKKTEPHSPMAYGIEQVVRWSDMTLPDLLAELIADGEARNGYFRLTGIPTE